MVHIFEVNKAIFALDTESGILHRIDQTAKDVLDKMIAGESTEVIIASYSPDQRADIADLLCEIASLKESQQLFTEAVVTGFQPKLADTVVKALCLHIAHDCNMRCSYCFAESGEYKVGKREFMTPEVGKAAVDFLINQSQTRHNLEMDFFGGEPLMNFNTIKEIVSYANQKALEFDKNIRYTLTTNGLLLNDAVINFALEHNIQLIMSHDGRPEMHNQMRPLAGGQPSYEKVTKNFQRALELGVKDYYMRGTYTAYNPDFLADIKHLLDLGFSDISFEPVVTDPAELYALSFDHYDRLVEEYEKLAAFYIEQYQKDERFIFFHYEVNLNQGPCLAKRLTGCGAGFDYMAVAPNGDLYPCHQFVGLEAFKVGSVYQPEELNHAISEDFLQAHVFNKPKCENCWAKYYCSGGCHADSFFRNGSLTEPVDLSCALQKRRLECALAVQAQLLEIKNAR